MANVEELGQEIAALSAKLDGATHLLLQYIRQFDEAAGWHEQGAFSCAHWLSWRLGWDAATAREKVRVARALGSLPAIDEALRSARLSYAKVRALTRVATPDNEKLLLQMALFMTGAQLERLCRSYRGVLDSQEPREPERRSVFVRPLPGGLVRLEMVLAPDEAELILKAVDRAREEHAGKSGDAGSLAAAGQPAPAAPDAPSASGAGEAAGAFDASAQAPWPTRADGAVMLAESFLAGRRAACSGGDLFQVMVHLNQDIFSPDGAWAAALEDGTRVSAETLRRIACDCSLLAVSRGGAALNIGRKSRAIPPAIRRALMLRDHGCAFPGCTHTRFLHAHHVTHWLSGGETSLENLLLLCSFHHRLVHEGGWAITAGADGVFHFHPPRGARFTFDPPKPLCGDATEWLGSWADIGPEVDVPRWDGKPVDYSLAVERLLDAG